MKKILIFFGFYFIFVCSVSFLFILYKAGNLMVQVIDTTDNIDEDDDRLKTMDSTPAPLEKYTKKDTGEGPIYLTYRFKGYDNKQYLLQFAINRDEYELSLKQFDYRWDIILENTYNRFNRTVVGRIKEKYPDSSCSCEQLSKTFLFKLGIPAASSKFDYCYSQAFAGGSYYFYDIPKSLQKQIQAQSDELWSSILPDEFKQQGYRLEKTSDGYKYFIDYIQIVEWNTGRVQDCFRALSEMTYGMSEQNCLGVYTAFLQDIDYVLPPEEECGRKIAGLWPPPEVLVNNHGDCDSKSATLCSLWKHIPKTKTILIEIPNHVMTGVRMTPKAGQQTVRIGNETFVICDVAGPARFYPGTHNSILGNYKYYVIE